MLGSMDAAEDSVPALNLYVLERWLRIITFFGRDVSKTQSVTFLVYRY